MGKRLLKEARGLLPAWSAALLLALGPWIARSIGATYWSDLNSALVSLSYLGLTFGTAVLAASAFGRELDHGTFGLLLSSPLSRWRIWWEKTGLLAVALASVWCAWQASLSTLPPSDEWAPLRRLIVTSLVLGVYGGGPLFALLTRQTLGGACVSLVPPSLLWVAVAIAQDLSRSSPAGLSPAEATQLYVWGAGAWAALAYLLALRAWLGSRDLSGQASIGLAGLRLRPGASREGRVSAWRALVWKEFHLQQWTIYLALVLPPLVALGHHFAERAAARDGSDLEEIVSTTIVVLVVGLMGIVPALAGVTTIAEERRLGTLTWQRTMPVSHVTQICVKLSVAWAIALFCAPWYPLLGGGDAHRLLWGGELKTSTIAVSAIVVVAIFGSSLARNLVEAILVSVATGLALVAVLWEALYVWARLHWPVPHAWSVLLGAIVGLMGTLVLLASPNMRHLAPSPRLLRGNALILSLVCAAVFAGLVGIAALSERSRAADFRARLVTLQAGCERGDAHSCEEILNGRFIGQRSDADTLAVANACWRHARAIIDGERVAQERERGARLLALAYFGFYSACVTGTQKACPQREEIQLLACDLGRVECLVLARAYESGGQVSGVSIGAGQQVAQDKAKAVELYARVCAGGESRGCLGAATLLARGDGVPQDRVRAAELYDQACQGGVPRGCRELETGR